MLANVIAFEGAGVPLKDLKQAVGRDGGTIIGRGVVFRMPIEERLSEEDTRQLIERYSKLVGDYSKGQLDRHFINNVKLRNNVLRRSACSAAACENRSGNATRIFLIRSLQLRTEQGEGSSKGSERLYGQPPSLCAATPYLRSGGKVQNFVLDELQNTTINP